MGYIVDRNGKKVLHCRPRSSPVTPDAAPNRGQPTADMAGHSQDRRQAGNYHARDDHLYRVPVHPHPAKSVAYHPHLQITTFPVLAAILSNSALDLPTGHPRFDPQSRQRYATNVASPAIHPTADPRGRQPAPSATGYTPHTSAQPRQHLEVLRDTASATRKIYPKRPGPRARGAANVRGTHHGRFSRHPDTHASQ